MSRISSCASCHGDLLIPRAALPKDQMRCPLCNAQFAVQDVLAASIPAPPEAIPVEQPLAGITVGTGTRMSRSAEPVNWDTAAVDVQPPLRKKQPGLFAHLIGVVGGGVLGLSLGYLGLLRYGGPQYDFLDVGGKLPKWVTAPLPKLFPANDKGDADARHHERGLEDLLNQPDQPPTVDLQPPASAAPLDTAMPPFPSSPFDASVTPPAQVVPPADAYPALPSDPTPPPEQPFSAPSPSDAPVTPANPAPPQATRLGPRQFSAYSAEDLTLAVNEVATSWRCPVCSGTGQAPRPVVTAARDTTGAESNRPPITARYANPAAASRSPR